MRPRRWRPDHVVAARNLEAPVVELQHVPLGGELNDVRACMRQQFGDVKPLTDRWRDEFARQTVVLALARRMGDSLMDAGCAHGIFISAAALCGEFSRVIGIDIAEYQPYLCVDGAERIEMDVTDMAFADDEFDIVTAQEIVEHLPGDTMHDGLAELRRVSRRRIITVPFCEGPPLGSGHHQRFDAQRVRDLFPAGDCTVFKRGDRGTPWLMIVEE